jgi:hypothetical protein
VVSLRVVAERKGERRGMVKMRVFIVDGKEICGGVVGAWLVASVRGGSLPELQLRHVLRGLDLWLDFSIDRLLLDMFLRMHKYVSIICAIHSFPLPRPICIGRQNGTCGSSKYGRLRLRLHTLPNQ